MSLLRYTCFASMVLAATLVNSAFGQPPERGFGDRPERRGPEGRGRPGGPPSPEEMMRMIPVLATLDADQDGKISKAEIENATAALQKLDKNDDGDLTEEELRPKFHRGGPAGLGGRGGPKDRGPGDREGRGPGDRGDRGPKDRGPGDRGPGGFGQRDGGPEAVVKRFMQHDKNDDGKLSKDELPERMGRMFDRADKDDDGVATRKEIEMMASETKGSHGKRGDGPGGAGRSGHDPAKMFAKLFEKRDANNDGKLSKDEMPEQMAARLEMIDADGDGSVSKSEMEAMASKMRERGGRRGPGGERRGPGGGDRPGGDRPQRPEAE